MTELNKKSLDFSLDNNANAVTDITGFGLLGHLYEMLNNSNFSATIKFDSVPLIENIYDYLDKKIFPSGSLRNYDYLSDKFISDLDETLIIAI